MSDFVTLSCPSCGGQLHLTQDVERFACAHCGIEHIAKHRGNVITIEPIVAELKNVRSGIDKTASELAIRRLKNEIRELNDEILTINSAALYFDKPPYNQLQLTKRIDGKWGTFTTLTLTAEAIEDELAHKRKLAERPPILTSRRRYEKVVEKLEQLLRDRREIEQQVASKEAELKQHEKIVSQ